MVTVFQNIRQIQVGSRKNRPTLATLTDFQYRSVVEIANKNNPC
jgi:hypothetical protein